MFFFTSLETKSAVVFVLVLQYPVMKVNILMNARFYKAGLPKGTNVLSSTYTSFYDAFTLTDTETFTETDKMGVVPNDIGSGICFGLEKIITHV